MKKILLIAPGSDDSQKPQSSWMLHSNPFLKRKAFTSPLHIATIAGLTPDDMEVDLWDEPVHGYIDKDTPFHKDYDLVGVTGYGLHFPRACKISRVFRDRGVPVAVGGAGVSSIPKLYRDHFDILFVGEAELTWPRFIEDFRRGEWKTEYRECELPDMALSPAPRWDSIATDMSASYLTGSVQVTRGCPFNCEFCDVWQIFGRKVRLKPVDLVVQELNTLQKLGVHSVMLCSDNFIGNAKYARELLRALIPVNQSYPAPLQFRTELTLTVARDQELLELLADTNFAGVLIGLESPNEASLKETRKNHNLRFGDLAENCRKILSYGIPIEGSLIVGFDNDTTDAFDLQFDFIQEACIPFPRIHMLKAIRGTDLWERLMKEGRVCEVDKRYGNTNDIDPQHSTNIIPKNMTRIQLLTGYMDLVERVFEWGAFEARMKRFIKGVKRKPQIKEHHNPLPDLLEKSLHQMDEKTSQTIGNLLAYARKHAPFMLLHVAILSIRNLQEILAFPRLRDGILAQIEIEKQAELEIVASAEVQV